MANKQWRKQQGKDRYFQQAKAEGYRARSAYKLQEIDGKFGLLRRGDVVLDIGAAPGSWSQVTRARVGPGGRVVAVDIQPMEPLEGVAIVHGDVREAAVVAQLEAAAGRPFDVVLSDIAPNTTGVRVRDHARSVELSFFALSVALRLLREGGHFVTKIFYGPDFDEFVALTRRYFARVGTMDPEATRRESKETFVVASGLRGRAELDPTLGLQAALGGATAGGEAVPGAWDPERPWWEVEADP